MMSMKILSNGFNVRLKSRHNILQQLQTRKARCTPSRGENSDDHRERCVQPFHLPPQRTQRLRPRQDGQERDVACLPVYLRRKISAHLSSISIILMCPQDDSDNARHRKGDDLSRKRIDHCCTHTKCAKRPQHRMTRYTFHSEDTISRCLFVLKIKRTPRVELGPLSRLGRCDGGLCVLFSISVPHR